MPLLGALLSSLAGSLFALLASFLTRKLAVATAAIAALATIYGVLIVAFNAAVAPLLGSMFSTQFGQFLGLAFPPVAGSCLAAIGGAWAAVKLFEWQAAAIKLSASA